ncbi:hypothetical protein NEUTE1DRAFT_36043 [Neurospora tetrasperma FGSC 2508]|uniref:Uncharacterized protein n=1 Tax=Neurospora tetrasperma (strain FGSC 2508 / ATCC MYA-4615 / P0657) TaxID=510951 RepID=F8MAH8_NEUT8|nr:uncharacterized protein NEUTE1DRAFT_36043 [Neurospora tetrasperma FGSC 2508]EGO60099.1 hypothetical protein NEUTE1DRAFT_36043 [Neurospora tetrasperma FGSC 2508]
MVNTNPGVNPLNHPMVQQEVDKEDAIDTFIAFLEQDPYADSYTTKLANALQDIAVKYKELADDGGIWHEYFELTLDKFLWDLPKTREELYEVVRKLTEVDVVHEAAIRGVQVQVVPKYRDQATSTPSSTSSSADAQVDAIAKRIAENLLADGNNAGGRKVEGENATIFRLESDDTPCTIRVYSGDGTTSTVGLIAEGTGPAILTVKVHKENGAAKPSELHQCVPPPVDTFCSIPIKPRISSKRTLCNKSCAFISCSLSGCLFWDDTMAVNFPKLSSGHRSGSNKMVRELTFDERNAFTYFNDLLDGNVDEQFQTELELSDALKNFALKYIELAPELTDQCQRWSKYFAMSLKKILRHLPSTSTDLDNALAALSREEVAAEARARGVCIQILPESAAAGNDKTPEAPALHQNSDQNANGKRPAENQAKDKVTEAEDEAHERPAKRVKHGGEDTTTSSGFTVKTQGSLKFRISDDIGTTTFNLNGRSPAIVTVSVQKKDITASASANGNKEAEKEEAA